MDTSKIAAAFTAANLTPVAQRLDQLACPSIRLRTRPVDEATIAAGASKLGGLPDLPPGAAWPQLQGAPMSFIAQVRLEDAQPADPEHLLPAAGLLSFFYDATQQTYGENPADRGGWQVLYLPGDRSTLRRAPAPAALPAASRFKPCAVSFATEPTLPQRPEVEVAGLAWSPQQQEQYDGVLAALQTQDDRAQPHDRMLGHPDTIQDDMRPQCALYANGVSDPNDPKAAALLARANDWLLLLQVDSDPNAGMQWASSGMLYYWIERAALTAGRFDNTWLVLQSE